MIDFIFLFNCVYANYVSFIHVFSNCNNSVVFLTGFLMLLYIALPSSLPASYRLWRVYVECYCIALFVTWVGAIFPSCNIHYHSFTASEIRLYTPCDYYPLLYRLLYEWSHKIWWIVVFLNKCHTSTNLSG